MAENSRDMHIDLMRGLCIIAVVLIHTVYHSGTSYTPKSLQNLVLLFDVPVFFFLTGCTISIHPKLDPFKQMLKFITLFFFVCLIGQLLTGSSSLESLLAPITLQSANIKYLKSIKYSYWFVPVYVVSLIYSTIILNYCKKYIRYILLFLIPIYYIYSFISGNVINTYILGYKLQIVLFYIWLILLGFTIYKHDKRKHKVAYILVFILSIGYFIFSSVLGNLNLQKSKFILSFPYAFCSMASIALIMLVKDKFYNKFLSKIGSNAIYYYISQGFGASILFYIVPHMHFARGGKLIVCFAINFLITLILGFIIFKMDKNSNCYINFLIEKIKCIKKS